MEIIMAHNENTLGSLTREFHHGARAAEVLGNLQTMLLEWQADYPEGKPFEIQVCNREFPLIKIEMIPLEITEPAKENP